MNSSCREIDLIPVVTKPNELFEALKLLAGHLGALFVEALASVGGDLKYPRPGVD